MIKDRLTELKNRGEPAVLVKIIREDDDGVGSHLINRGIKDRYRYYKCDYCGEEIKLEKEWAKQTGGTYELPHSMTKRGKIIVALHNRCFKKALKEFEED